MILSIVAYGSPILRKQAIAIETITPEIKQLIVDMWDTLYISKGVGLAAPQVNQSVQLFLVDSTILFSKNRKSEYPDAPGFKGVFINPVIRHLSGEKWTYNEGCLSIPKINADINREEIVDISYMDENFEPQTKTFNGITARIILHEYDHLQGKLFIDYLTPLQKKLLKNKLNEISNGKVSMSYPMIIEK